MGGYVFGVSSCIGCGQTFCYNPDKVPSLRVEGIRQPVCRNCIEEANPIRIANGLEPIAIQPGAYEALPEEEL
jgi:hypothetical protein